MNHLPRPLNLCQSWEIYTNCFGLPSVQKKSLRFTPSLGRSPIYNNSLAKNRGVSFPFKGSEFGGDEMGSVCRIAGASSDPGLAWMMNGVEMSPQDWDDGVSLRYTWLAKGRSHWYLPPRPHPWAENMPHNLLIIVLILPEMGLKAMIYCLMNASNSKIAGLIF